MTNGEFKAWFEGFTEAFDAAPNKKQWERIKARVKEIDGKPTERVYVDRYWGPYYNGLSYPCWQYMGGIGIGNCHTTTTGGQMQASSNAEYQIPQNQCMPGNLNSMSQGTFDSYAAMQALGRAEAAN